MFLIIVQLYAKSYNNNDNNNNSNNNNRRYLYEYFWALSNVLIDFLNERKQQVFFNDYVIKIFLHRFQSVELLLIFELLYISVFINNFSDNINFAPKLFADDTLAFSIVCDINQPETNLNHDLEEKQLGFPMIYEF